MVVVVARSVVIVVASVVVLVSIVGPATSSSSAPVVSATALEVFAILLSRRRDRCKEHELPEDAGRDHEPLLLEPRPRAVDRSLIQRCRLGHESRRHRPSHGEAAVEVKAELILHTINGAYRDVVDIEDSLPRTLANAQRPLGTRARKADCGQADNNNRW